VTLTLTLISFVLNMLNNLVDEIDPDLDLDFFVLDMLNNRLVESDPDHGLD
jgi:hypothetical protein